MGVTGLNGGTSAQPGYWSLIPSDQAPSMHTALLTP
jgi:hypothetical protein